MTPNEIAETFFIILKGIFKGIFKWLLIIFSIFFVIYLAYSGYEKINAYFENKKTQKLAISQAKERQCIGSDISRMEESVKKLSTSINAEDKINQIATRLSSTIKPATDDITQKVLVYYVPTTCDSPFSLLINIRADQQGNLMWFRVWAQDAPPDLGYPSDLVDKFTIDFDAIRLDKKYQEMKRIANAEAEAKKLISKKQSEEAQRKNLELEAWKLQHSNSTKNNSSTTSDTDPCAINLSKQERLRRLGLFGSVKQNSENSYSVNGHWLTFDYLGRLSSCY